MKKLLLTLALSALAFASTVSADDVAAWQGGSLKVSSLGHYFVDAEHYYYDEQKICLYGGKGGDPTDSEGHLDHSKVQSTLCSATAIDLPPHVTVHGFQAMSNQGLHLRYNMSSDDFNRAFFRARVHYVG